MDVMVAPSHYVKDHPSLNSFRNNTQIVVINPGVNIDIFQPNIVPSSSLNNHNMIRKHVSQGTPVIGFLARFSSEKSPGLFLAACQQILLKWPFAKFVIIGAGDLELYEYVNKLGLNRSVELKGGIYDTQLLASEVRSMTVVVNPSLRAWSETFCIANIEVMAAGVYGGHFASLNIPLN